MLEVGKQLIDALDNECTHQAAKELRTRVDSLAMAYLEAIGLYREAMKDEIYFPTSSAAQTTRAFARK
jgi:hypothetical protein